MGISPVTLARLGVPLAWVLIAAIAVSAAYWTWRLVPLPSGAAWAGPAAGGEPGSLKAQHWFASTGPVSANPGRYTLRWLYAGRPGVCILGMPGLQDRAFRTGDEIEPGVTLRQVASDHVLIQADGGTERIQLPEHQAARPSAAFVPPPPPAHIEPDVEPH